jgi:CDP-glucose 4,6-dehydratase
LITALQTELLSAFKGRRVLVTGHTGFKGSWLCKWLLMLGADVTGFSLPPVSTESHFAVVDLAKRIDHIEGDVRDYEHLRRVIDGVRPEVVFHLAAQALVKHSYADPKSTMDVNFGGSINVLEGVRANDCVRALVFVTSDKCYRNQEWIWGYRENDELGGNDPYSASKAAAEIAFYSYLKSYFSKRDRLGAASVRAGNVIGGGDWAADRVVPDCIRALVRNQPIILRNPRSTRPWQHVLEPISGYLLLASKLLQQPHQFEGAWNFGPAAESCKTVRELTEVVVHQWGAGEIQEQINPDAPREAGILQLNSDKARQFLGWRPVWDFHSALQRTVAWYQAFAASASQQVLTDRQIHDYMENL